MTSRHTNPIADSARTLSAAILALPAPRLSPQTDGDEIDALASYVEDVDAAIAAYREDIAAIAKDHGATLGSKHLASDAEPSDLVRDLRDAACDLAAAAPEPGYDRLTAADYGVGRHRIGGLWT